MIDSQVAASLLPVLAFAALLAFCARLLLGEIRSDEELTARLRTVQRRPKRTEASRRPRGIGALPVAAALGGMLIRQNLLPRKMLHEAEMLLLGANLRGQTVVAGYLGGKVLLLLGLPPLAWMSAASAGLNDQMLPLAAAGGATVALLLPDFLLGHRRRRRLATIERGMPDALDLLVICVDAGLSFEAAMERVSREVRPVHPDVADEFSVTVNSLRISPDRHAVLMEMGERLDVDFLRQLAATLAQALQIGAPLSRALGQLAVDLRREQMIKVEARAAKLPVLLTIPMVLFILPPVLMVVIGPAAIQMYRTF